ncbi:MAG: DUF2461 domain-containing protein [Ruminococcaceae bacterium]|jgi:uncharacterized protein (TIGR02453 family)|nr:DUF2461 domain-containing protein [Oscillospiraceae bacterium]
MSETDFRGFSPETQAFLMELTFNNERPWFNAHKDWFERALNVPFKTLADQTLALMRQKFPNENFYVHVSRIYRDARRLFGRGPYKDHLWFTLQKDSPKSVGPVFWFEIDAFSWSWGVGHWEATPRHGDVTRRRIREDPKSFLKIVHAVEKLGDYSLSGEPYKRPKGDVGPELNPWYNRRRISVSFDRDYGGALYDEALPQQLLERFTKLMPLYRFLLEVHEEVKSELLLEEQQAVFGDEE